VYPIENIANRAPCLSLLSAVHLETALADCHVLARVSQARCKTAICSPLVVLVCSLIAASLRLHASAFGVEYVITAQQYFSHAQARPGTHKLRH
jgi:hypothetical protein